MVLACAWRKLAGLVAGLEVLGIAAALTPVMGLALLLGFPKVAYYACEFGWRCCARWILGKADIEWSGVDLPLHENALVLSNHMTAGDWLMLVMLAKAKGMLGVLKFFIKEEAKWIPGIGWGCYALRMVFVSRDWARDKDSIANAFQRLKTSGMPFWLASFLEGTRKTPKKLAASQAYAKKKDLPNLNHLLLPRTKGFVATVQALRNGTIDAVYDVTLFYAGHPPTIFADTIGKIHVHLRRWAVSELPTGDAELHAWCMRIWTEKDELIQQCETQGHFPGPRLDIANDVHVPMLFPE
eukprot:TRINITY_DN4107_c0_g1_i1.p1 TRINITY_DN4107_c0_g1~~TRINITY_DN4107_c0_g1_i1.p1  ORF type:complete len:319 (+),score=64.04 TRINITY_DN4107_c0_g1_i1:69-959(+)